MATGGGGKKATKTKKRKGRSKKTKTTTSTTPLKLQHLTHLPSTSHEHISQLIPNLVSSASAVHSFLLTQDLQLLPSQSLSLESLLSSTAFSLSKLLSLISHPTPHSFDPPPPSPPPPVFPHCWFHRFLSSASNTRWAESFNISKSSFDLLLRILTSHLSCLSPVPPNYALAATLFRLTHSASYSALARRFNFDSTTACRVFYTVCKAITENLGHLFEFKSDMDRIIVGFGWISLPNCCGVLGFEKFEFDSELLGENDALIVQALVDSEGRFLDVSAGWPSSLKPENILRNSKLYIGVEESKEYLNGPSFELNDGKMIPQYIVGEPCLPLLPWLLTPYRKCDDLDELNKAQLIFNSAHERGIDMVRMVFGGLRKRWKLVSKVQCVEAFALVIVTCCLLHNFLIKCSEEAIDDEIECLEDQLFPVFDGKVDENAKAIRDAVASHLTRIM